MGELSSKMRNQVKKCFKTMRVEKISSECLLSDGYEVYVAVTGNYRVKAITKYQKLYAYYGLIYEMNRYYLEDLKLKYVNDGARSITNYSNIQPFLIEKFNSRKAYCHLDITYRWWSWCIINVLYPFRAVIPICQVKALLNMEAMARGQI